MALGLIAWIGIFILSLAALIKSSDYFTDAAEKIGIIMGIPAFVIGVTIVAIGTSLPELISSIFAVLGGASEIVVGNVVGANIVNIFLVIGIAAVLAKKIEIDYEIYRVDLPILVASAFFILITCWDGVFNIWEGLIGLGGFVTYLSFAATFAKKAKAKQVLKEKKESKTKKKDLKFQFLILLISGFFIFLGARYVVESVINLSEILNIGKEIIAMSALALGTTLPELTVVLFALKKGNTGLALGNILGSNIFNSLGVLGISAIIGPLFIPQIVITFGIPVMLGATLLYFFMVQDRQITIWEGIILLLAYVLYIGKIFGLF